MPVTVKTKKRKEKKKNLINLYIEKVRHAVLCQEVPFFFYRYFVHNATLKIKL